MDLQLRDQHVLITGGSKGIGRAIAEAFVREGAKVAIVARKKQALEQAQSELRGVVTYQADLINEEEREQVFEAFIQDFGTIDILINNVGGSQGSTILETDLSIFEEAMQLNYYSCVHFSKLAAQEMRKKKSGSIINISSIFGRESGGKATYNNAKSAMISFTKAFADEAIQYGIRVNGVAPGAILHPTGNWQRRLDADPEKIERFVEDNIPAGRFGTVEEVADVVIFLASARASWIVGATVNVDGGQSRMNF